MPIPGRVQPDSTLPRRILISASAGELCALPLDMLRDRGYEIVMAESGHRGDFIAFIGVVDGADGRELIDAVRRSRRGKYTYIILVPSDPNIDATRLLEGGADDVFQQPVDPGVLLGRVRVAERIAGMQADLAAKNHHLASLNARMLADLESAARVQQVLLPSRRLMVPGLEIAWRFKPSNTLAGDILNYFQLDENHIAFYVLDVSGHGVSAALLSVQVARMMSPMMSESELLKKRVDRAPWYRLVEPIEVIRQLNELFRATDRMTHYFTIVFGQMDLRSRHIRFVSAGHPGPIHVSRRDGARAIRCSGTPVGLVDSPRLEQKELELQPGDRIWFYSDGISDAENPSGAVLGVEGLVSCTERSHHMGAEAAADEILAAVEEWCPSTPPDDDCSLLAIGRLAPPEARP